MKRAHARQLAIVNWQGVFYERFELSNTVTAFEGANGAGKTTVLIAAFVALLPDMRHLRFTNIGEHAGSAGDKGIWGRLGETGRPSYTVLDLDLATGERLLAGVRLERRTEPAVDLTPFLVTDLPHDADLQDVLLLQDQDLQAVPELEELRQQTARFGAKLHQCTTAMEYFDSLFERGVTPLRLDKDAERGKLAEMLRTSMTGGMSRVLTTGLRAFLLKEERGLTDTVKRMRSNIAACRRTRAEVDEAQALESEISRIYEAGQEMFNCGLHATLQRAEETAKRSAEAEQEVRTASAAAATATKTLQTAKEDRDQWTARRDQTERERDDHRERVRRLRHARDLRQRITRAEAELEQERRNHGWNPTLASPDDIDALRRDLIEHRNTAHDQRVGCERKKQELEDQRTRLKATGNTLSAQLLALSDRLGGEPLATRYEELSIEEAASYEARLGPLAQAIVVNDPESAARDVIRTEHRPDTVWLVTDRALRDPGSSTPPAGTIIGDDAIVHSVESAWRVSRIPKQPVLGRRARTTRLEALQHDIGTAAEAINNHRGRETAIENRIQSLDRLATRIGDAHAELAGLGIDDPTDERIAEAEARLVERQGEYSQTEKHSRKLEQRVGELTSQLDRANRDLEAAGQKAEQDRATSEPARQRWETLRAKAEAVGVHAAAFAPEVVERFQGRGTVNLYPEAQQWAKTLQERFTQARDGLEMAGSIGDLLELQERSGDDYLTAWLAIRSWLHRRVPAQMAQMDDPLEALTELRSQLTSLKERLKTQERGLQGDSATVAYAIGTQIGQAHRDIARLNDDLKPVRFGGIEGVRLGLRRVPEMANVLESLREGEDQARLFTPDIPLEDALDAVLKRHGGRGNQGHRVLDYREYIEPRVEIKRQTSTGWESASANRVSTGESIGIGAALMMVVLTEWERSANLLRAQRAHSTLRLLFLDEANRLDKRNLGVLFDLCQNLNLQLLVAAPEVAQAQGNTTYRLAREVDAQGRPEVRVTGRRIVGQEAA